MTREQIDRVFGRGRLKMVTGEHVEVFREAAAPGESRRYTKRFLNTQNGDFGQWTEREWRILARLIGHGTRCVPDVVQYDRGTLGGTQLVQTYDAGPTVDQWATMLPVERDGRVCAHIFEDCAHWWALAHHCLVALDEIHPLQVVHLDVKGDNVCIPIGPRNFDSSAAGETMHPVFRQLALIDFAFSLVSGERLTSPLPIGWQKDYDYQSPRLLQALEAGQRGDLQPTEDLDWRCDMYSLAAMLKRYLPGEARVHEPEGATGWTVDRYDAAKSLILTIRQSHDRELPHRRPHPELLSVTSARLRESELAESLDRGWTLARNAQLPVTPALPLTPMTRIAPPLRLVIPPRDPVVAGRTAVRARVENDSVPASRGRGTATLLVAAGLVVAAFGVVPLFVDIDDLLTSATRWVVASAQSAFDAVRSVAERSPPAQVVAQLGDAPAVVATPNEVPKASAAESIVDDTAPSADAAPVQNAASTMPAVASSTPVAGESPGSAADAKPVAGSFAAQIETYRSQALPRPIPRRSAASAPSAPRPPSRANSVRLAEQGRRSLPAAPGKQGHAKAGAATSAAVRPPAVPASKQPTRPVYVASSPHAILTPPPAIIGNLQSQPSSPPIVAQPAAAPVAEARASAAASTNQSLPSGSQNVAEPRSQAAALPTQGPVQPATRSVQEPRAQGLAAANPSAIAQPVPQTVTEPRVQPAPSAPTAAITFPAAPPVEQPRAQSAPTPPEAVAPSSIAPGIEASRGAPPPSWNPAPRAVPPSAVSRGRAWPEWRDDDDDDFIGRARRTLAETVPRSAAQAHAQIARVLWTAANAHHPAQERAVVEAVYSTGMVEGSLLARDVAASEAKRLNEEARQAFWSRRQIPEAFDLQLKAFGANPNDPEVAGNLALLHLKLNPPQPERARQLALHAMAVRGPQHRAGRLEDWMTFAIASALTGREADAKHALYVSLALTRSLDRSCRAALSALAIYGERLREPVEAMLYRLHSQGRGDESPYCAWPPDRIAGWRSR